MYLVGYLIIGLILMLYLSEFTEQSSEGRIEWRMFFSALILLLWPLCLVAMILLGSMLYLIGGR